MRKAPKRAADRRHGLVSRCPNYLFEITAGIINLILNEGVFDAVVFIIRTLSLKTPVEVVVKIQENTVSLGHFVYAGEVDL